MNELDDLLNYGSLSREELLKLSKTAGFTQPSVVELFRWVVEFVSQIQLQSTDFILKGGTAAQLYISPEKQRGSVDADLMFLNDETRLAEVINILKNKFSSNAPFFQFSKYTPKNPTPRLPLQTYWVNLPSVLIESCRIKLDVLLSKVDVPFHTISSAETFVGQVKNVTCLTRGALVGDKLLTLARGTIGVQQFDDYPKQIYDLEMLVFQTDCAVKELADATRAVQALAPVEASFRSKDVTPEDALEDVKKTTTLLSNVDLASAEETFKKAVNDFQQFYVNNSERRKLYEWSSRVLRIRFLASLIQLHLSQNFSLQKIERALSLSKSLSKRFRSAKPMEMDGIKNKLLKFTESHKTRELRGKPLDRIFWDVVTPENVEELEKIS
ncbi:MAG: nucleotidyl transferase AbiEii/AbiGii toxin family protein [Conexivisphaerales archaeon]